MNKLLNVENDWDGEVDCAEVMWPCCLFRKKRLQRLSPDLKLEKQLILLVW